MLNKESNASTGMVVVEEDELKGNFIRLMILVSLSLWSLVVCCAVQYFVFLIWYMTVSKEKENALIRSIVYLDWMSKQFVDTHYRLLRYTLT